MNPASEDTATQQPPIPQATSVSEALLVLGLPLAYFAALQAWQVSTGSGPAYTNRGLWMVVALEIAFGTIALAVLRRRQWTWSTVSEPPTWGDLGRALLLYIATLLLFRFGLAIQELVVSAAKWVPREPLSSERPAVTTILALVVVNPLYEEGLWLAYILNGPGRRHERTGIALSLACRTSMHLYQGWSALFGIAPIGLMLAWYYTRSRRLLPPVLAHSMLNLVSSLPYVRHT